MLDDPYRVQLDGVDWQTLLPVTRLFRSFRMAIHPAKLGLGILLVVLLYLTGVGLDAIWGARVSPTEFSEYLSLDAERFDRLLAEHSEHGLADRDLSIFETALRIEADAFEQLAISALSLDFGLGSLLAGDGLQSEGVIGALITMVIAVPGWLLMAHPGFLIVYLLIAFLLTALLGGAISRLSAIHACTGERAPPIRGAVGFTVRRYPWFVLAPIFPPLVAGAIALVLSIVGLVLFNLPVLEVIGGLIFGLLLLAGFIIAVILIALVACGPMLWTVIAVEGTDAFDAISRAFNYILGRPWRWLFYNAVAVVYGAITYLFLTLVVFLTLWVTQHAVGWFVFTELQEGANRFEAVMPPSSLDQLIHPIDWINVGESGSATITAWLIKAWVMLLVAVLPAYAVCFFFSAQTWIYLLLRWCADGTAFEDVFRGEPEEDQAETSTADQVEPVVGDAS